MINIVFYISTMLAVISRTTQAVEDYSLSSTAFGRCTGRKTYLVEELYRKKALLDECKLRVIQEKNFEEDGLRTIANLKAMTLVCLDEVEAFKNNKSIRITSFPKGEMATCLDDQILIESQRHYAQQDLERCEAGVIHIKHRQEHNRANVEDHVTDLDQCTRQREYHRERWNNDTSRAIHPHQRIKYDG